MRGFEIAVGLNLLACAAVCAAELTLNPGMDFGATAAGLRPGDVLTVAPGVYEQGWTLSGLSGSREKPITIRGTRGAVLRPRNERDGVVFWGEPSAYVVIEGLTVEQARRGGIMVFGSHDITIRRCILRNNGVWGLQTCLSSNVVVEDCDVFGSVKEHGLYFSTTDGPVVTGCRIHDNAACGIHLNGDAGEGGDGMIRGARIERCAIFNNGSRGGAAINMDGVSESLVAGNLVYGNRAGGIVSFVQNGRESGSGNRFIGNSVTFDSGTGRFALSLVGGGGQHTIRGNILVCGRGPVLQVDAEALRGLVCDRNVYWRPGPGWVFAVDGRKLDLSEWRRRTAQDAHSLIADPLLARSEDGGMTPATNSPALTLGAGAGALDAGSRAPEMFEERSR